MSELAGIDAEKLYASLDSVHRAGRINSGDFKDLIGMMAARNVMAPILVQGLGSGFPRFSG